MNLEYLSDRQKIILEKCNINGFGLEIGPSFNPVAPKKAGFNIEIIDHLNKQGLIEKYKNDLHTNKNVEEYIEEVDYIWKGESYVQLIGKKNYYDYIISSHLIEHVPDVIQHLQDCSNLLKYNGIYSLAIPHKYYMFDCFRSCTTIKECIDQYMHVGHSKGTVAEYYLNVVYNNGQIAWEKNKDTDNYCFVHSLDEAKSAMYRDNYIDIHNSVFTPISFQLLINDLKDLGYIDFEIIQLKEAEIEGEFYVVLQKKKNKTEQSNRMELIQALQQEYFNINRDKIMKNYFNYNKLSKKQLDIKKQINSQIEYYIDQINVNGLYVEMCNEEYRMTRNDTLYIRGWGADRHNICKPPYAVYIGLGDFFYIADKESRPDVINHFNCKKSENDKYGFYISIPGYFIDYEKVKIKLVVVLENKDYYMIDTNYSLVMDL